MRRTIAVAAVVALLARPSIANAEESESGKHKGLGMAVGLVSGLLLGGYAAGRLAEDSESVGAFFTLWTAFAAGGAIAGYAVGGGFDNHLDVALDDGRQAIREASNRRTEEIQLASIVPLPELRLASLSGFESLSPEHVAVGSIASAMQVAAFVRDAR